jgi:hypothetical protein
LSFPAPSLRRFFVNGKAIRQNRAAPPHAAKIGFGRGMSFAGTVTGTRLWPKRKSEGLDSCSGHSRRAPILQRFASESTERVAGNKMALNVEGIVDGGVKGQEPLY